MIEQEKATEFTALQLEYVEFLATAQTDPETGRKINKADWARGHHIGPDKLYDWQKLPGFYDKVVEATNRQIRSKYPPIMKAMYVQALKGNVHAVKFLANQGRILEAEKQEIEHSGTMTVETVNYGTIAGGELATDTTDKD